MGDKSLFGMDTVNPWTKSLYVLEASGYASSTDSSFSSFLNKLTGTEVIASGTIIQQDTVIAANITATSTLATNDIFKTQTLLITNSQISSSDPAGITITPGSQSSGASTTLNYNTFLTGNVTATNIFNVGTAPNYILVANADSGSITINAPITLSELILPNGMLSGSGSNFIIQGTTTGGDIVLKPATNGKVDIDNLNFSGNAISATSGITLAPGSGNVGINDRLYLIHTSSSLNPITNTDHCLIYANYYLDMYALNTISITSGLKNIKLDAFTLTGDGVSGTTTTTGNYNIQSTNSNINLITTNSNSVIITNTNNSSSTATGSFVVLGGMGISKKLYIGSDQHTLGIVYIDSSLNSTDTQTGAMIITGGVGIAKDTYIGGILHNKGIIYADNATNSSDQYTGSVIVTGGVGVAGNICTGAVIKNLSSIDSSNYQTGSIITTGGVGIAERLNVNGDTNVNYCQINSSTEASGVSTGALYVLGGVNIKKSLIIAGNEYITSSTLSSSTSTGALIVTGGVGISQNIYVGGSINISGTTTINTLTILSSNDSSNTNSGALQVIGGIGVGGSAYIGGIVHCQNSTDASNTNSGSVIISGGVGIAKKLLVGGILTIYDSTETSNTSTGSLVIDGGIGIAKSIRIGNSCYIQSVNDTSNSLTGALQVTGGICTGKSIYTAGNIIIDSSTLSHDSLSGALTVNGGIGVQKSIYVGDKVIIYNSTGASDVNTGALQISGGISTNKKNYFGDNTTSSSTSDGSLVINGGVGIAGITNMMKLHSYDATIATTYANASVVLDGGCGIAKNLIVGTTITADKINILSIENAVDNLTGALTVAGGIGCNSDIRAINTYIETILYTDTIQTRHGVNTSFSNNTIVYVLNSTESNSTNTGSFIIAGGVGVAKTLTATNINATNNLTAKTLQVSASVNSVSTSTGTIVVSGGVGISQSLYAYDIYTTSTLAAGAQTSVTTVTLTGSLVVAGGMGVYGNTILNGDVKLLSNTDSNGVGSGALVIKGGAGISGHLYSTYVVSTLFTETVSDIKYKENIDYDNILGLDFIKELKPCKYNVKNTDDEKSYGFIAQDMQKVLDKFDIHDSKIITEDKNGLKLGYMNLISILVKSVQDLNNKVELLQEEVNILKNNKI